MKWLALSLLAFAAAAHADADGWNGWYGGLGAGGGNARSTWNTDFDGSTEEVSHKARGGVVGGQIGYRWGGTLLAGLELAWYGGKIEDRSQPSTGTANSERVTKVLNPGSLALQLGVGGSHALVYARGGLAFASIERQAINQAISGDVATWETTALGWTAGTGFEVDIRRRLSLGLEYDYARLTAKDQTVGNDISRVHANDFKARLNIVLLRLNFRY